MPPLGRVLLLEQVPMKITNITHRENGIKKDPKNRVASNEASLLRT